MAIIMNAKGTTSPYFKIGKQGTNIFQGSSDPASSYTTVEGDLWIDTSNKVIKFRNSSNNGWTQGTSSITGNLTVSGDLTINGTTTTLDTTNLLVEDPLLVLARSASGTPTLDAGLVIERGSSTNVGFIWDESADQFAVVNTTESGSTAGNVSIASYANIRANEFHGDGSNLTGITSGAVTALNNATVNELVTVGSTTTELDAQSALTFDGSTLTVAGTVTMAGGSTSADFSFGDSDKALFGAGNDLQIYHDGSNSYILENGTGNLIAKGNAGIYLRGTNDEEMATFLQDGAVTLYHDNTARIATTSAGVDVTGTVTMDGGSTSANFEFGDDDKATFGAGADLKIWHSGSTSYIQDAGTGSLYIDTNGTDVSIISDGSYANGKMASFVKDGAAKLYYDNSEKIATTSAGIDVTGTVTMAGGSTSADFSFADDVSAKFGTGNDLKIYHSSGHSYIYDEGDGYLVLMSGGPGIRLNSNTAEVMIDAVPDGAVTLYHNNSAKLATSSSGVTVTGDVTATDDLNLTSDGAVVRFGANSEVSLTHVHDTGLSLSGEIAISSHIDIPDNAKIKIGTGDDLEIYHDGSNSYIDEGGTGSLIIKATQLILKTAANETSAYFTSDGAATLYHNNSAKLETTSAGVTVTGKTYSSILEGAGGVTYDPPGSSGTDVASDVAIALHSGTRMVMGHSGYIRNLIDAEWQQPLIIGQSGTVAIAGTVINGGTAGVSLKYNTDTKLQTTTDGVTVTGDATISGNLTVNGTTTILDTNVTSVDKLEIGASSTDYGARINQASTGDILQLQDSGTTVVVVKDGGNVGIGTTSPTQKLDVNGTINIGDGNQRLNISAGSGGAEINNKDNSHMRLSTNDTLRVHIGYDGLVGIGTGAPAYNLDVAGTFRTTGDLTLAGGAVLGSGTLSADGQNDIFLFSTGPTTGTAQSGAYHNKLKILGGSSQTRDLQLYQVDSGYATIDSSWTSNQLTIGSAFTQVNFQQDIIPSAHNTYSLGQEANYFDNAYSHHYWSDAVSDRLKFGVWDEGAVYAMGMGSGYSLGALNDYAMTFQMNSDADRGFWWGTSSHSNAQGAMSLTTGGHLYVAGSVRLGDGTSFTSGTVSPTYKLDVNGAVNIGAGSERLHISAPDGGVAVIGTVDSTHLRLSTNDTVRVHIGNDGLVGIGTTTPITDLHIVDTTPQIRIESGAGTDQYGQMYQSGGITYFMSRNASSHGQMAFNTYNGPSGSNIERMRLTSLGRLGVGTASPAGMIGITAPSDTRAFHYYSNQTNVDTSMYAGYIDANMTFTGGSATGNRQGYALYMDKDLTGTLGTTTTNNNRIYNVNLAVDTRTANSSGTVFEQRGIVNLGYVWPTGTGNVDRSYGILNYLYDYQPNNSLQSYGAINGAFKRDESTGTTGTLGGAINYCSKYATSGNVTTMYGSNNYVDVDGGTVGSAIALRAYVTGSGTGTITSAYGVYVNNYYTGGTITNSYGLYVNGFDKHYLEGKVGIGTTTPATALDVNSTDAIVIPKGTTAQRPGTPESGMVRFNTTTSCFEGYNGSSWINLGAYS